MWLLGEESEIQTEFCEEPTAALPLNHSTFQQRHLCWMNADTFSDFAVVWLKK